MLRFILVLLGASLLNAPSAIAQDKAGYEKYFSAYRRPSEVPYPRDNTYSHERELLGQTLFFDPRLSGSNWISCASCHNPGFSWGDGLAKSIGHGMQTLARRTPTILNSAWSSALFWDGRAETLEEQALGPIQAPGEMNLPLLEMVKKLNRIEGYKPLFAKAYPGEAISEKTVAKAIATYERAVSVSAEAPFDRWINGDGRAISAAAKRGFLLFNEKAACSKCHSGWRFTDDSFHDIGIPGQDLGRGALFPDIEVNQFAFKTPTLRNVSLRAPYMHDGSESTLVDAIELYDLGGREKRPSLSSLIQPLNLTEQDKQDLIEFLKTLNSPIKNVTIPTLPQ